MKTPSKAPILVRIRSWFIDHKRAILITIPVLMFLTASGLILSAFIRTPQESPDKETVVNVIDEVKPIPTIYYSKLTGLQVENETNITKPVTAVMIENSPEARPQSGLNDAEIIFEAIAEGGITRFMALYQNNSSNIIGPVRSVRIYYINWLAGFDASIAHAGGSSEALAEVRNGNYVDLDQFFNAGTYWRSDDRYAPHNLYTSSDNLNALNSAKGFTESDFTGFARIDGAPATVLDATNISIDISSYLFNSTYAYSVDNNNYQRSQAGEAHLDREDGQLAPSVIIALHVNEYTQDDGHENIENIGSGNATIFQNGTVINAIWTKNSKTSQISFTDAVGAEIPLVRGQTWIVAVPNRGEVTWN